MLSQEGAAGLYGVLAYLVTQRTSEIGIWIALGAQHGLVLRGMMLDGLRPAPLGLVLGLGASAASVRLIRSMLYELGTRLQIIMVVADETSSLLT